MIKKKIESPAGMIVQMIPIGKIKPYPKNPRINDSAVAAVSESIKRYGFRQPIVVDKDMVVIVGHTRLKAAISLGMKNIPVHVAGELTKEQVKAYRLVDNRTNEISEWDIVLLKQELVKVGLSELELGMIGFNEQFMMTSFPGIPDSNSKLDEDAMADTKNECPKCGFKW